MGNSLEDIVSHESMQLGAHSQVAECEEVPSFGLSLGSIYVWNSYLIIFWG